MAMPNVRHACPASGAAAAATFITQAPRSHLRHDTGGRSSWHTAWTGLRWETDTTIVEGVLNALKIGNGPIVSERRPPRGLSHEPLEEAGGHGAGAAYRLRRVRGGRAPRRSARSSFAIGAMYERPRLPSRR